MAGRLTHHANLRASQRNFSQEDIDFICRYGHVEYNAGARFYQLRHKDLPRDLDANDPHRRLVGATVLECTSCRIIKTVYKNNPRAFRNDRRKAKWSTKKRHCHRCRMIDD